METDTQRPKLDYTKTEAAQHLDVTRPTVYRYIRQGILKLNKRGRITAKSLMEATR